MHKEKLTVEDLRVKRILAFVRGSKTHLKNSCKSAGRMSTTFFLIQTAYNPDTADTEAQQAIREIGRELFKNGIHPN